MKKLNKKDSLKLIESTLASIYLICLKSNAILNKPEEDLRKFWNFLKFEKWEEKLLKVVNLKKEVIL